MLAKLKADSDAIMERDPAAGKQTYGDIYLSQPSGNACLSAFASDVGCQVCGLYPA